MWTHPIRHLFLVWVCALAGCTILPAGIRHEMVPGAPGEPNPYLARPDAQPTPPAGAKVPGNAPPTGAQLASGQLMVWSNPGATGLFVNLFTASFSPWTHIGVVSVEPDGVFVYESNAELEVSSNGPARVSGDSGVLRTPYQRFLDSDRIYGLYDPPPEVNAGALVRFVKQHHRLRTPFDPRYDSSDDAAFYCSELVARGFEVAGSDAVEPVPARRNRSYDRLRAWLDVSSAGYYLPGQLVERGRRVAVWARGRNLAQIEALFAARAELARRFDAGTRLGLLLRWDDLALGLVDALDLRDAPRRLVRASEAAFASVPDAEVDRAAIAREVARLADALLGGTSGR